ncbi:MerR family transcriptional regulator [Aldersonia sp. NBC_00410]|uniref:MerR family transcriptional regulator n=1 Tax=Aldersonia sp. NBC_00410 TaxID=2975954 RepID=UPI00224DBE30|nr:MerR family transcriptional regulator [Aldersonia sp. NBC_00410]MCX5041820.1 MerR family transcriptional regulator [Aldersonia sp. NBC_00410]
MPGFLASESARLLRGLAEIVEPREDAPREMRIDDLARAAGVSVRNVRVYQERGLLPPPRRTGRTAWYSEAHLARLDLIGRMLDRGYTFAAIGELLTAARYGMRVEDVLARANLDAPGTPADVPVTLHPAELADLLGAENLAAAIAAGLCVPVGDGYRVASARLIEATRILTEAGVTPGALIEQAAAVRHNLRDVAQRFVGLITDPYLAAAPLEVDEQAVSRLAEELSDKARKVTADAVSALLAEAMEEAISESLERLARRLSIPENATQGSVE